MKTAILICNNFSVLGGEERFAMDLARALNADIIVPSFNKDIIKTYDPNNEIQFVSLNKHLPSEPLKQLYGMWIYSRLKLDYDFLIALDDMSVHALNSNNKHLYYVVTPRKAFYEMYYYTLSKYSLFKKIVFGLVFNLFSMYDRYYVKKNVKNFVCISHTVRNRICKTYQRDATVIYPPVHTEKFVNKSSKGYWLHIGRIDKWKRVNLQVEAFRQMPDIKLIIVGKVYPNYEHIVKNKPSNVTFLNNVTEEELIKLYSECEGYIATSLDEDFGISPIEAMSSGKPVIATKEGGHLETVIDGHTGILVSPNVEEIIKAVKIINGSSDKYKDECQKQALKFDYLKFKNNITNLIFNKG